ncbi:MAG: hypothetical protein ACR2HY_10195, partial [Acidimicrobiales bacterium]
RGWGAGEGEAPAVVEGCGWAGGGPPPPTVGHGHPLVVAEGSADSSQGQRLYQLDDDEHS